MCPRFERDLALAAVTEVIATYHHRLALGASPEAMASLAAPINAQKRTLADEAFARVRAAASRDHRQPRPDDAVREDTEVTSRFATQAELDALGYTSDVIVTQTVRTTVRADSTPIVRWVDPADLDPDTP
ncbi:hypothetical protein [Kitasatospora sp. NPDC001527]|uniref:hypothetical protein n=1 Tax=Kitasatospora sp. NPDC001527 TaxID=3154519 RepID=UPI003316F00D